MLMNVFSHIHTICIESREINIEKKNQKRRIDSRLYIYVCVCEFIYTRKVFYYVELCAFMGPIKKMCVAYVGHDAF